MDLEIKRKLVEFISEYVTGNKKSKIDEVLTYRTRHITVVLEDIFQSHNSSAVVRSCDCFGIQDIHVIENKYDYDVNRDITLGSAQWVNIIRYKKKNVNNSKVCIDQLRTNGYKIIATSPHEQGVSIRDLTIDDKTALLFGTELEGLSDYAMDNVDSYVTIPMYGFTESLNLSVCAAIFLFHLTQKLHKSGIEYVLSEEEQIDLRIKWMKSIVKNGALMEKKFLKDLRI